MMSMNLLPKVVWYLSVQALLRSLTLTPRFKLAWSCMEMLSNCVANSQFEEASETRAYSINFRRAQWKHHQKSSHVSIHGSNIKICKTNSTFVGFRASFENSISIIYNFANPSGLLPGDRRGLALVASCISLRLRDGGAGYYSP